MDNYKEYKTVIEEEKEGKSEKLALLKGLLLGILIMAMCFIIIILSINYHSRKVAEEKGYSSTAIAQKIDSIFGIVNTYYAGDASAEDMINSAMKGLIDGVGDKYAQYYTAEEFTQAMQKVEGNTFSGIGVVGTELDDGYIGLLQVYTGSPAESAGLKRGDTLKKIDGMDIAEIGYDSAMKALRGEEGTNVEVTYLRDGAEKSVTITRAAISTPTVAYRMIDEENKVGYIYIASFQMSTAQQFLDAIDILLEDGMERLIIDLRYNGGGDVDTTCVMLDRLLPEGTLVSMIGPGYSEVETSDAENYLNIPIVVLANEYSASASEIFIGALKDFGAASVVGTKTYGKGVVQRFYDVGDGSYVKLTVAKYYTPNGTCVDGVGITPDYEVELDADGETDNQFEKALEVVLAK